MHLLYRTLPIILATLCLAASAAWGARWRQVHPHWQRAYVFSFRSPDLLTNEADEQWGYDGRLVSGGILTDFPAWLAEMRPQIEEAREDGRQILLSIHVHSGYGTGLVTYSPDLRRAEVATYPWLIRRLNEAGLNRGYVTVAVDTCNSQATAAHQLRPDLIRRGVEAWGPFKRWRAAHRVRRSLPLPAAYRLFSQDRVASHLAGSAKGRRGNVDAEFYLPLKREDRRKFKGRLYGQRGVILATPAFFNLLRLGPEPRGTLTANLLTAPLNGAVVDALLARNKTEFHRFKEYAFLKSSGIADERYGAVRTVGRSRGGGSSRLPD